MTFVITQSCCEDAACVPVCPVQCIRPRPGDPDFKGAEQLYIDPSSCIDCGACATACPVDAIYSSEDLPSSLASFKAINAEYFVAHPLTPSEPPSVARHFQCRTPFPPSVAVDAKGRSSRLRTRCPIRGNGTQRTPRRRGDDHRTTPHAFRTDPRRSCARPRVHQAHR